MNYYFMYQIKRKNVIKIQFFFVVLVIERVWGCLFYCVDFDLVYVFGYYNIFKYYCVYYI